jgi:two-component system CheB/CheR fusion protein
LSREGNQAVLSVRDDGIGMSAELVPRAFELFVQGERGLDRSDGGLGIGLTLVQRLVELHGGTVAALSRGPGQGSEFVVRLPRAESRPAPSGALGFVPEPSAARPLRVLVVDDNPDAAETCGLLIRAWGHEGMAWSPDVVLLDIGLPDIDGYEVARRIRAREDGRGAVLVAMTGYGQAEDRQRSREAGFTVHLVKPVDPTALKEVLAGVAR